MLKYSSSFITLKGTEYKSNKINPLFSGHCWFSNVFFFKSSVECFYLLGVYIFVFFPPASIANNWMTLETGQMTRENYEEGFTTYFAKFVSTRKRSDTVRSVRVLFYSVDVLSSRKPGSYTASAKNLRKGYKPAHGDPGFGLTYR